MPYLIDEGTRKGFKVGDRIEFTGTGTVESLHGHNSCFTVEDDAGYTHNIYPGSSKVKIQAADPANWPPKVGDVWEISGREYFARNHTYKTGGVVLVSEGGGTHYDTEFKSFAVRNPKLIRGRSL